MSVEHGGHGASSGIFFVEGISKPAEDVWNSIFDIFTLFVVGFFAMFDTPVKSPSHGSAH